MVSSIRIVYVSSRFPCTRQAFEYHEVLELQKISYIRIFSFRNGELSNGRMAHEELGFIKHITYFNLIQLASAFLIFARYPIRSIRMLLELLPYIIKAPQYAVKLFGCFLMGLSLSKLIFKQNIEHIHANFVAAPGTVAYIASRVTGRPFSMKAHAGEIFSIKPSEKDPILKKKIMAATFTAFISCFGRDFVIRELGLDDFVRNKLVINRCGIDICKIEKSSEKIRGGINWGITDTLRIISCGALVPKKGFHVLIHTCYELYCRKINIRCDIFGEGPQKDYLMNLAKKVPCPILFHGVYSQKDLPRILKDADIFVLSCIQDPLSKDMDGIPVVLMEAMAAKIPVVSTRLSGIPELVEHRQTGLLANPGNINDLADCIELLTDDQTLRERLTKAAYIRVINEYDKRTNALHLFDLIKTSSSI